MNIERAPAEHVSSGRVLAAVLLLAAVLRLWGVGFGLPDLYHADEPIVVNHALAYGTGDFNPHFFKIPPLASYLLFGAYGLYYVLFHAFGGGISEFQKLFIENPTSFYLIARIGLGVLPGVLTIFLLFRLIRRFFDEDRALLSALFLSAAFLHVRDCHYVYADIPLLLILVACFFPVLRLLEGNDSGAGNYMTFGFLAGAAVAMKYNGVFVAVPFLVAHFLSAGLNPGRFPHLILSAAIALGTYSLLNPYTWLDWSTFWRELAQQGHSTGFTGPVHHLSYSLSHGLGLPLLVFALIGLAAGCADRRKLPIVAFVIVYYTVLCFFSQHYDRYALPLVPFACFFAADLHVSLRQRFRAQAAFWGLLIAVTLAPSLVKIVQSDLIFSRKDVRTLARQEIESTLPAGSRVALDVPFFMPRLRPVPEQLEEKYTEVGDKRSFKARRLSVLLEQAKREPRARYELWYLSDEVSPESFLMARPQIPYSVPALEERGIRYVLVARINPLFQEAFFRDLFLRGKLLKRWTPFKDKNRMWPLDRMPLTGGPFLGTDLFGRERNGQIIELYELPAENQDLAASSVSDREVTTAGIPG